MTNLEDDPLDILIRRIIWSQHDCPEEFKYGDNGEMQCNNIEKHPAIDFLRDSQKELFTKIYNLKGKIIGET
jgi:hypothetical protein